MYNRTHKSSPAGDLQRQVWVSEVHFGKFKGNRGDGSFPPINGIPWGAAGLGGVGGGGGVLLVEEGEKEGRVLESCRYKVASAASFSSSSQTYGFKISDKNPEE